MGASNRGGETGWIEVRGFPPLRQKKEHRKDGAPRRLILCENRTDIGEGDHQRHRLERAGVEAEGEVEAFRLFRDGVDYYAANSNGVGSLCDPAAGIAKQAATEAAALPVLVHC